MKWKGCGRKRSRPKPMQYPDIFVEGMRNATKNLSQDSRCPDLDSNRVHRERYRWSSLPRQMMSERLICKVDSTTESESYVMTDGQPASLSWNKAPIWGLRPDLYYCLTVAGLSFWGALFDERTGLSFTIPAGPRQRSHFLVLSTTTVRYCQQIKQIRA
jgi:hypothetical protein